MNSYSQVISILKRPDLDFRKIVYEIAEKHPKIVVDTIIKSKSKLSPEEIVEIRLLLKNSESIVPAVKRVQELRGCSFYDAKQIVDSINQ